MRRRRRCGRGRRGDAVTLLPRSLFGRLALLLLAVVAIALAATILFFRQDRAALLARQFGDTKIVQLQTLRAALEGADAPGQRETLARIGRQYGARIIPESRAAAGRSAGGSAPGMRNWRRGCARRWARPPSCGSRRGAACCSCASTRRAPATGSAFRCRRDRRPRTSRRARRSGARRWRWCWSPPRSCSPATSRARCASSTPRSAASAAAKCRRRCPNRVRRKSPTSTAASTAWSAQLTQAEHDRALLLAGVSHDLRTPLARMRLAVEMGGRDEALKAAMVDDIEEMDRIIGQFLDFARGDQTTAFESRLPDPLVAAAVDRYARAGSDVRFARAALPAMPLKATAFARLVTNLVDNALKYGAPPVEVTTRRARATASCWTSPTAAPASIRRTSRD